MEWTDVKCCLILYSRIVTGIFLYAISNIWSRLCHIIKATTKDITKGITKDIISTEVNVAEENTAEENTTVENMKEEKAKVCIELTWICDLLHFNFPRLFFTKQNYWKFVIVAHFLNWLRIGSHKGHHKGYNQHGIEYGTSEYGGGQYGGGEYEGGKGKGLYKIEVNLLF